MAEPELPSKVRMRVQLRSCRMRSSVWSCLVAQGRRASFNCFTRQQPWSCSVPLCATSCTVGMCLRPWPRTGSDSATCKFDLNST